MAYFQVSLTKVMEQDPISDMSFIMAGLPLEKLQKNKNEPIMEFSSSKHHCSK